MKIYEGNAITPKEEYENKDFLAPDLNTYSDIPQIGWSIVEKLNQYEKYVDGVLTIDIDQLKQDKIAELKTLASSTIIAKYPEYKQINAGLGIYTDIYKTELIGYIQDIRAKTKVYEEEINDAETKEEIDNIVFVL